MPTNPDALQEKTPLEELTQELEQELAELKKITEEENLDQSKKEETEKEITRKQAQLDALKELIGNKGRVTVESVDNPDIGDLYGWNKGKPITKQEVMDVVNNLKEPYNTDISKFIKEKDIEGLQKYLNQKIREGKIDSAKLAESLKSKGIRFDGSILEDGKFGPQTLETIKFILYEEPTDPEKEKKVPDLSWIPEEMDEVLDDVFDTNRDSKQRDNERNLQEGNPGDNRFNIDLENKRISLATWGKEINGEITSHVPGNRCELDWEKGIIYVICDQYTYEIPVKVSNGLEVDENGYPKDTLENRKKVNAFTKVGNLMNMIKANYVFNGGPYSFEQYGNNLEYNNGMFADTDILKRSGFEKINRNYATVGVNFGKEEIRDMACLLNAMKYDIGKLTMEEIEDGCTDEDVERSKHFSKRFAN